jgi:hypothetical protein
MIYESAREKALDKNNRDLLDRLVAVTQSTVSIDVSTGDDFTAGDRIFGKVIETMTDDSGKVTLLCEYVGNNLAAGSWERGTILRLLATLEKLACRHVTDAPLWWQEEARAALDGRKPWDWKTRAVPSDTVTVNARATTETE